MVGLAVLLAIVLASVVIVTRLNSAEPGVPEATPTTDARTPESTVPAAAEGPTSGRPTVSVQTAPPTAEGSDPATFAGIPVPAAGPGVTQPGILLMASPATDGSFDVLERVRLPSPIGVLTLRPAPIVRAGQQFASASAAATQVEVSAGDQSVDFSGATVDAGVELPVERGEQFELKYRLTGVTIRSAPSPAGRALAAIGPLTGGVADDFPVLIVVSGGTVLGLSCPLLPLSQQSCGSRVAPAQSIERELPWSLALATVQFNVPPS